MKPNGKTFAVRAVSFVVCTVGLFSAFAGAQTVHGSFKLPVTARWGKMLLSPGQYEFTVDTESTNRMLTVRSTGSSFAGMVLCSSVGDTKPESHSMLELRNSGDEVYVKALYLREAGVVLEFETPKALSKIAKAQKPSIMASTSGSN